MKTTVLWVLLDLIFLIVFNVLFFAFGNNEHPTSVWISYGFIHFAYFLLLATPLFVRKGSASTDYRRSLFLISSYYFFLELIAGTVFILVAPESIVVPVVVQLIMVAISIAMLLSNMIANEHTADSIEKHEYELKYVRESSAQLEAIMRQIPDNQIRKKVENIYDLIHGSQVKSSSSVRQIEENVKSEINQLEQAVLQNNIESISKHTERIYQLAEQRNRQLRLSN